MNKGLACFALFVVFALALSSSAAAANTCVHKPATVTVTPFSRIGLAGKTLNYTVKVKNNNVNCGVSSFNISYYPYIWVNVIPVSSRHSTPSDSRPNWPLPCRPSCLPDRPPASSARTRRF
jgi:hypothetical protein